MGYSKSGKHNPVKLSNSEKNSFFISKLSEAADRADKILSGMQISLGFIMAMTTALLTVLVTSLQEALDFYGVTEVSEPRWIPSEFVREIVTVDTNGVWLSFFSSYANDSGQTLVVSYNSYQSTSLMYYEKAGSLLETFSTGGTVYNIFENVDNRTAAWITPHFECCISVPADAMDIDELKDILSSIQ